MSSLSTRVKLATKPKRKINLITQQCHRVENDWELLLYFRIEAVVVNTWTFFYLYNGFLFKISVLYLQVNGRRTQILLSLWRCKLKGCNTCVSSATEILISAIII